MFNKINYDDLKECSFNAELLSVKESNYFLVKINSIQYTCISFMIFSSHEISLLKINKTINAILGKTLRNIPYDLKTIPEKQYLYTSDEAYEQSVAAIAASDFLQESQKRQLIETIKRRTSPSGHETSFPKNYRLMITFKTRIDKVSDMNSFAPVFNALCRLKTQEGYEIYQLQPHDYFTYSDQESETNAQRSNEVDTPLSSPNESWRKQAMNAFYRNPLEFSLVLVISILIIGAIVYYFINQR